MHTPEGRKQASIDEQLEEFLYTEVTPNSSHEEKKGHLRKKCAVIAEETDQFENVHGRLLAQNYFKLLHKNPQVAQEILEYLYGLHYHATDPETALKYFNSLRGIVDESEINDLWNIVSGIIKGEYEVMIGERKSDKFYFLYNRADAAQQKNNPNRKESLKHISRVAGSDVFRIPEPVYRAFEFAMFEPQEQEILEQINEKLRKQTEVLVNGNVEIEDIFEHFQWIKQELKRIISELKIHERSTAKYQVFFETVTFKYLDKLYEYANKMNRQPSGIPFLKDLAHEIFVIFNANIDDDSNEVSPINALQVQFQDVEDDFNGIYGNHEIVKETGSDNLGATMFFSSNLTPVGSGSNNVVKAKTPQSIMKTSMGMTAPDACQQTKRKIANSLNETVFGRVQVNVSPKPQNMADPLAQTELSNLEKAQTDTQVIIIEGSNEEREILDSLENDVRNIFSSINRLNTPEGVMELDKKLKDQILPKLQTPETKKAFFAAVLIYVINFKKTPGYKGKNSPLWIHLRNVFSSIIAEGDESLVLPKNKDLVKLETMIPDLEKLPHLKGLTAKLGIEGLVANSLHAFREMVEEDLGALGMHINTDQSSRLNPFEKAAFERLRNNAYNKLTDFEAIKARLLGQFGTRIFRRMGRSKDEKEELSTYIKEMEAFLPVLKEEALDPTFNNIEKAYYPTSSSTASHNSK